MEGFFKVSKTPIQRCLNMSDAQEAMKFVIGEYLNTDKGILINSDQPKFEIR